MTVPLAERWPAWERRLRDAAGVDLALDFDGTLTDHVADPHAAALRPGHLGRLARWLDHPTDRVAIVSGRSIADLRRRVPLPGLAIAGNHGLEIEAPGRSSVDPAALAARPMLDAVANRLKSLAFPPGVSIGDKGLTVAVDHYDLAEPTREIVHATIARVLEPFDALTVQLGRHGCDIRPRTTANKGTAGRWLFPEPGRIVVAIGDDRTDDDLFDAFPDGLTVGVGARPTTAICRVDSPADVDRLWDAIAALR